MSPLRFRVPVECQNGHKAFYFFEHSHDIAETCRHRIDNFSKCTCPKHELGEGWRRNGDDQQSTGLFDAKGVEIFEGDVLRKAGIVTWNQDGVRWSCIDIEWNDRREWHDMLYLTTPLEVIGNVWQNPELLPKGENPEHSSD